jgi:membrane-bound lytic murein transglycosylase B
MRILTSLVPLCVAVALSWPVVAQSQTPPDWNAFLAGVFKEARAQGISEATLHAALDGIMPIERVIELDRRQPEGTLTFEEYMAKRLPPELIAEARSQYDQNLPLLLSISEAYGVDAQVIVALWGHETRFGLYSGGFDVVPALATLAWDARRSEFFRKELMYALKILDEGQITPDKMRGSWAGAMGQSQFMPSSFNGYAEDWDRDGRRDIWTTKGDVFASAANYLSRNGWQLGEAWGAEVVLPAGYDTSRAGHDNPRPLSAWLAEGITFKGKAPLIGADEPTTLAMPAGPDGAAYLVFSNYRVILKWNRSDYFAMSVVRLADLVVAR